MIKMCSSSCRLVVIIVAAVAAAARSCSSSIYNDSGVDNGGDSSRIDDDVAQINTFLLSHKWLCKNNLGTFHIISCCIKNTTHSLTCEY